MKIKPEFFMIFIMFSCSMMKSTLANCWRDGHACPEGQVYDPCDGNCPPSCRNEERACTQQYEEGCVCANDYVFDFNRKCIPRNQCCPEGRVESECGAKCQPTCEDPQGERQCTKECVSGCVCASGTVLRSCGNCVKYRDC